MFKNLRYGFGESKREFSLSPYSSEIEREILIASTVSDDLSIHQVFEKLEPFIKPFNKNISVNEKKLIIFSLIGISIGEEINSKQICPKCSKPHDKPILISHLFDPPLKENQFIKIDEVLFFFSDNYDEFDVYELVKRLEISQEFTPPGIKSIKTSDKGIIKEAIDNLSLENYQLLENFLQESRVTFTFYHNIVCPYCKHITKTLINSDKYVIDCTSEDTLVSFYKSVSDLVYYGKYTKEDIYKMIPFERNIYYGLLTAQIAEYKQANPN